MVADGSTDLQERPKIALVRSDNPPALIRHVRDLIEVAADNAEFSDGTLQCQQFVARKRRQISQMHAGEDGHVRCCRHPARRGAFLKQ